MTGCKHNAQRTIEYWPTGPTPRVFNRVLRVYERGPKRMKQEDIILFRCPHGCDPIIVSCQGKDEEE